MRRFRLLSPLFAVTIATVGTVSLTACLSSDVTSVPATATVETTTFAPSLGIDLTAAGWTKTSGGLWYRTTTAAVATAPVVATGQTLSVKYIGFLSNGTTFDAGTISVLLGANQVIPGFEQGLVGMHVGESRRLLIPPSLGYGAAGNQAIPGNAVLVFDVTVVSAA